MFTLLSKRIAPSKPFNKEAIDMAISIRKRNVKNDWRYESRNQNVDMAYVYARGVNSVVR